MFKNNCKCGSTKFYLQYKGAMVGKYCSGCNKWQRWVGKKDLEIYKRNGFIVFKDDSLSKSNGSSDTAFKPCVKCNSDKFYLKYKGEMVGKYCAQCDRWSSWVGKKLLMEFKNKGYDVKSESYINPAIGVKANTVESVLVDAVSHCVKCGDTGFYIKEKSNNIGKYCSSCNKWLKWIKKDEVRLLQSKGVKVHPETYLSHHGSSKYDLGVENKDKSIYVDHSDVYVSEYIKHMSDCNKSTQDADTFIKDNYTNNWDSNINKVDTDIDKKELNKYKNDTKTSKNDIVISDFKFNITQNDANMFLLEKFVDNTPNNCFGCLLESKCDMMIVKLCDSIRDAIDFVEISEVF